MSYPPTPISNDPTSPHKAKLCDIGCRRQPICRSQICTHRNKTKRGREGYCVREKRDGERFVITSHLQVIQYIILSIYICCYLVLQSVLFFRFLRLENLVALTQYSIYVTTNFLPQVFEIFDTSPVSWYWIKQLPTFRRISKIYSDFFINFFTLHYSYNYYFSGHEVLCDKQFSVLLFYYPKILKFHEKSFRILWSIFHSHLKSQCTYIIRIISYLG